MYVYLTKLSPMKNYSVITQQYLSSNGLRRCHIKNQLGEPKLYLLTDQKIKAMRSRGVIIEVR